MKSSEQNYVKPVSSATGATSTLPSQLEETHLHPFLKEAVITNSAEGIRVSVRNELKTFKENFVSQFKEAMATKPADPNPSSSSEAAGNTNPQKEPAGLTQSKPVSSANQAKKAASM